MTNESGVDLNAVIKEIEQDTLISYMPDGKTVGGIVTNMKALDITHIILLKPDEEKLCLINLSLNADIYELIREHDYVFTLYCISTSGREYTSATKFSLTAPEINDNTEDEPHHHIKIRPAQ